MKRLHKFRDSESLAMFLKRRGLPYRTVTQQIDVYPVRASVTQSRRSLLVVTNGAATVTRL